MKITIDLRMKRLFTVAKIRGNLDATLIAEPATRKLVKKRLVQSLRRSKLSGTVFFDEEQVTL